MMKNILKNTLFAGVLLTSASSAFAQSVVVGIDPLGLGGATTPIDTMDWAPGNALAVGVVPVTVVGQTFDLLYQAKLANFQLGGANVPNTGAEMTIVLGMGEKVKSIAGTSVEFDFNPAGTINFFEIWSGGAAANDLQGSGFNDGTLVMRGTVTSNNSGFFVTSTTPVNLDQTSDGNDWGAQQTVSGLGATGLTASVLPTDINPLFFPDSFPDAEFNVSFLETLQAVPFRNVNPSTCMVNAGGGTGSSFCDATAFNVDASGQNPLLGPVNGLFSGNIGDDFIFETDGKTSFQNNVAEPESMLLFGMGLTGLALSLSRRRLKA